MVLEFGTAMRNVLIRHVSDARSTADNNHVGGRKVSDGEGHWFDSPSDGGRAQEVRRIVRAEHGGPQPGARAHAGVNPYAGRQINSSCVRTTIKRSFRSLQSARSHPLESDLPNADRPQGRPANRGSISAAR